ncbi:MAG: nuclease-related domain-containing protein [Bacteroides graminisolvens]
MVGTESSIEFIEGGINPKAIFHDLYIQKPNGEYTQVRCSRCDKSWHYCVWGVRDYGGWIFGNEHQRHWTQLLAYGKEKHRFYNPVMQNSGHIQAIRQCLPQNPVLFILLSYSSEIVSLRMLLVMQTILL